MEPLEQEVKKILRKIFSIKYGKFFAEIIVCWPKIVGLEYYDKTWPIKIISIKESRKQVNILCIGVINSSVGLQINYRSNLIVESLALYFGRRVVDRIKISG